MWIGTKITNDTVPIDTCLDRDTPQLRERATLRIETRVLKANLVYNKWACIYAAFINQGQTLVQRKETKTNSKTAFRTITYEPEWMSIKCAECAVFEQREFETLSRLILWLKSHKSMFGAYYLCQRKEIIDHSWCFLLRRVFEHYCSFFGVSSANKNQERKPMSLEKYDNNVELQASWITVAKNKIRITPLAALAWLLFWIVYGKLVPAHFQAPFVTTWPSN